MKYVDATIANYVQDLCFENYKTLMKEIKDLIKSNDTLLMDRKTYH